MKPLCVNVHYTNGSQVVVPPVGQPSIMNECHLLQLSTHLLYSIDQCVLVIMVT